MGYRSFVVMLCLWMMLGCSASPIPVTSPLASPLETSMAAGSELVLAVGEQGQLPGSDLQITFQAVLEDSRCPVDVDCAWAGQVRIELLIEQASAAPITLELTFMTDNDGRVERQPVDNAGELLARVDEVAITIVSLIPYPTQLGADETEMTYQLTLTKTAS